jgi:hypothetical protein
MASVEDLARQYRDGSIEGKELASMVERGELSKSDRRKIVKLSSKETTVPTLTPRQQLRLETKEKKTRPKLSKEERKKKYKDAEIIEERDAIKAKFTVCLGCRKRGHLLKNCPDAKKEVGICFNCGSSGHALRACPLPRTKILKFAKCFVCSGSGHISRDCPENANGLYPQGGCCHICLQKTHLVRDCPLRTEEEAAKYRKRKIDAEDDLLGPRIGEVVGISNHGDDYEPALAESQRGQLESLQDDELSGDEPEKKAKKRRKTKKSRLGSDETS